MVVANAAVLRQYRRLYRLSRTHSVSQDQDLYRKVVELSSQNPKWITLVSQASVLVHLVLISAKFVRGS